MLELIEKHRRFRAWDLILDRACKLHVILGVSTPKSVFLAGLSQTFGRKLPNRLEHVIPLPLATEQALVDQRVDQIHIRITNALGRLEGVPAGEDGKVSKQTLLPRLEQLVAPSDGGSESSLALRRVSWPSSEQRQAPSQALQQGLCRERLDAYGCELERERQAVQSPADFQNVAVFREVRLDSSCPLSEERGGFCLREWGDRILAFQRKVERLTTRYEKR